MTRATRRRLTVRATLMLGASAWLATAVAAQGVRAARPMDAAVVAGDLDAMERALYDAVRRSPRDPGARAALGAWLASRGQLRSGAVLLEESRLFGGDATAIAARLVHVYTWLRDWASLMSLPASPLSPAEKTVIEVLLARGTTIDGPDSTTVPFAPLEVGALGRMPMQIGTDTLWVEVDPQTEGLVLPGLGRGAGAVDVLADHRGVPIGVVRECAFGALTLRGVPVRVDGTLGVGRARMGFDLFAQLAPTVDARAGTATLRRGGRVTARDDELALPVLLGFPGVQLVARAGSAPVPIAAPAGRAALRGRTWSVDLRGGVIWVGATR